jgi:transcriptional regulator with XRE-family HTH domain
MPHMRAARLLAENVSALLKKKGMKQTDLAQWCRHSDVWVSQFLRGERNWQLDDLDRVADFLGLDTHELFRPGIAAETDRRVAQRRVNPERRVGHAVRNAVELAARIDPSRARKESGREHPPSLAQAAQLHNLIADFARRVGAVLSQVDPRGQTPNPRARRAKVSGRDRAVRGSGSGESES